MWSPLMRAAAEPRDCAIVSSSRLAMGSAMMKSECWNGVRMICAAVSVAGTTVVAAGAAASLWVVCASAMFISCAFLIHGRKRVVSIQSDPTPRRWVHAREVRIGECTQEPLRCQFVLFMAT